MLAVPASAVLRQHQHGAGTPAALQLHVCQTTPTTPHCPFPADMDGFKLLEIVGLELGLPVISE